MDHLTGHCMEVRRGEILEISTRERGRGGLAQCSLAAPEESRVGTLTEVERSSLAQLWLQLLPVSQRVGELLEILKYCPGISKYFQGRNRN